jgi:hypothetical protein
MASEYTYVVALLVGAFIGRIIRRNTSPTQRDSIYTSVSAAILLWLLPFHVLTATLRAEGYKAISGGLMLMAWGAVFCLGTLLIAMLLTRLKAAARFRPEMPFVASTFAGGGRAVLLAAAVSPLVDALGLFSFFGDTGTMIDALAIFDVGYWVFYVVIVSTAIMPMAFRGSPNIGKDLLPPVAILIAAFVGYVVGYVPDGVLDPYLPSARWIISSLVVVFAALSFALKFEMSSVNTARVDILFIVVARLLAFAPLLALAWLIVSPDSFGKLALLALMFFVAPPSSFVDKLLLQAGAPLASAQRVIPIGVLWNLPFVAVTIVLAILSLLATQFGIPGQ